MCRIVDYVKNNTKRASCSRFIHEGLFPLLLGENPTPKICPHIYIGTFFMWKHISARFIFTWSEKLYPFLSAIYLDLVSYLMEPTGTGQVCYPVHCQSVPPSAEFKHRNISANAVHMYVWGDWQHLKGHWVKGERQSCCLWMITRPVSVK
jgi:hypothetical protein